MSARELSAFPHSPADCPGSPRGLTLRSADARAAFSCDLCGSRGRRVEGRLGSQSAVLAPIQRRQQGRTRLTGGPLCKRN
jgi:hypothetical protein